jgi:subtilisin family serine protease
MKKATLFLFFSFIGCLALFLANAPESGQNVSEDQNPKKNLQSAKAEKKVLTEASSPLGKKNTNRAATVFAQKGSRVPSTAPERSEDTLYKKNSHASILDEITLQVLDSREAPLKGQKDSEEIKRKISLRKTSFKYPYLIVEESFREDLSGRKQVGTLKAMVADHLLINLNPQTDLESARQRFEDLNCSLGEKIATGIYIVEIQGPPSISKHYEKRALLGEIEEVAEVVEPDYFLTISRMPDDSGFSRLWGMHNTGQTGGSVDKDVDGPEAWNLSTGSKNVLGAVIDTGIDREHEDLMVNMWTNPGEIAGNGLDDDGNGYVDDVHGWDFVNNDNNPYDDNGHGTHCAGTIGGVGNNGKGVAGVAWNVSMVGIKFLSRSGSGATSDAVKSVAYATGIGVDFSSNSWGGGGASSSLKRVIEEADQQGIAFIAAAGNHGANNDVSPSYPASYDLNNVIAVGAHASTGKSASFSCYGQRSVDLFAPGVNTYSTVPGNKYASFSGTSMATPHVAGAYALIQSMRPEWGVEQIKASLMTSTDEEASLREKCVTGGRLNVFEALQAEPAKEKLIAINPTELDFGKIAKNAKQNMEFSISNSGSQATTLSNAFLTGNPAFALSLTTPFQIPAGTQIKGSIILEAGAEGLYQAELILESDAENAPRLPVPLSAEVIATPNLAVTPESLHFDLREGQKKTQSITLSNTGDGNLHYEIKFPSAANWLASPFPSTNKALETSFAGGNGHKGNYLEVEVLASSGIQVDSMTGHFRGSGEVKVWRRDGRIEEAVKSNDGWNEVVSTQVSTSGQEKKKIPVDFQLSPGKHTLLFSNSGSIKYTNATFGSVAASDENLSILVGYGTGRTSPSGTQSLYEGRKWNGTFHYSIASKENKGSLSEGQSIRIETIANADNLPSEYEEAYLCVTSNDPEEPEKLIKVSARMLSENAGLVFRPSSLTFGDTYRGQTAERDLVMSNAGTKDLTINQFAFRNSDFSHRLSLPITLRSGDQRTETIYFSPKTSGQIEGSALVLTDEEGGTTRSLQVSGRGSIAPEMAISPPSLSATLKSAKQKTLNLMISNSGGSPLSWTLKGATTGGGKALATPFFAQSHFLPLTKGSPDNRKGMPISTLGGGPDFYGYNWTGSFEPSGPTHQWKDISGSGRVLPQASGEDDGFDKVTTPFPIELYGKTYKEVFVSSNGYLTLERGSSEHGHFPLPSTMMPGNLIAPFAMDLDPSRGGEVYLQQDTNEVLVQWNKVKDFAGMGEYTFQVSLNRNGVVYFHYEKMDGKVERATTGIQNATADQALLVAYNNKQIRTESTIRLSTSPKWLFAEKTSGIVAGGENLTIPIVLKSGSILAGAYEAIIEIKGNAPGNPATTVPVKLIVEATRILEINPLSVDFGEVEVGVTRENSVQLTNIGNAPITMDQINLDSSFFEAVSSINTLAPGETSSITLQFSPEDGTSYTDRCELISNAENSPTALTVAGKGLATPKFKLTPGSISISLPAGEKTTTLASLANEGKASGNFTLMEVRNENSVRIADGLSSTLQETVDPFAAEHVPNRLIVRYKDGQTQFASSGILTESVKVVRKLGKARNGENGLRALSGLNMALVETAQNSNLQEVAKALSMDPAVAYVEPDYVRRGSILPDDPDWSQQYALKKIQAPEAWERTKGSPEVIVAVIDTGIDYNHKDLQGNLWKNPGEVPGNQKDDDGNGYVDDVYGWDFHNDDNNPMDGNRHGTHVAGTIAAASNNGLQVAGVAWNAKLVALKFLSDRGWGSVSNAIDAVAYCTAMNFPISNNSWGGGGSSKAMQEAIERAAQNGHLFCAAAGNSGTNNDRKPHYPSSYTSPNILSVAASDSADRLASFTCFGKTSVDLAAPGVSILNLVPNNRVAKLSGTSMATPHVAGAAALVLSLNPNARFAELKQALMHSVDPIQSYKDKMVAPGRLNLLKALEGYSPNWLSVSPEKGSVAAGKSSRLTFSIDATKLTTGTKRAVVCFETNDPLAKVLEIPVELKVTGEPQIATDKKSLDFEKLWVGKQKELALSIANPGTDVLKVSSLILGNKR